MLNMHVGVPVIVNVMYIFVHMHIRAHIRMCAHMYSLCLYIRRYINIYIPTYIKHMYAYTIIACLLSPHRLRNTTFHADGWTHLCTCRYSCRSTCNRKFTCIYVCTHAYTCVYTNVCQMYIPIYMYTCTRVYIYIHMCL